MWIFVCHLPIAGIIDDSDASQGVTELTGAMEELEEPEELEDMEEAGAQCTAKNLWTKAVSSFHSL